VADVTGPRSAAHVHLLDQSGEDMRRLLADLGVDVSDPRARAGALGAVCAIGVLFECAAGSLERDGIVEGMRVVLAAMGP
jgi:hypothetical protein